MMIRRKPFSLLRQKMSLQAQAEVSARALAFDAEIARSCREAVTAHGAGAAEQVGIKASCSSCRQAAAVLSAGRAGSGAARKPLLQGEG